ncbi:MAG TPA: 3-dehydroquinate synthase [Anaerolineae bacterium]|nr:3-dehydroquinate synthase [Anaerolineae bacterium]
MEPNLILTGFMGTGKTTVGRAIAERLKRTFVDTDAWIEERAGKSVAAIFAEDGEDRFRAWEAEACAAFSEPQELIIATGGWTLGPVRNRELMEQGGRIICLTTTPEKVMERLSAAADRPLLAGDDRGAKVRELLKQREPVYRSFAWQVNTTEMSTAEVMLHVMALYGSIANLVEPDTFELPMQERSMSIRLGADLLDVIGTVLRARGLRGSVAVIGDSNVAPLYGDRVAKSLAMSGFEPMLLRVPAGEASKTLDTASVLYEKLVEGGLERGGLIIALGGGMIGDLAGFVAATYLRGIQWVCVPTSLLAMIDASIGGKVGVDLPSGKNLVGAFYPPLMTISDMTALHSLPGREFRSGLAEMIKAGVIADAELFAMFEASGTDLPAMMRRSIQVKVDVVREDPFEKGRRAALNLGHTIGHGLESASKFGLLHGEAIAIGTVAEARAAERIGLARSGVADRIERVIERADLPTRFVDLDIDTIIALMRSDKKKQGGRLKYALPRDIGDVVIGVDVKDEVVREVLIEMKEQA